MENHTTRQLLERHGLPEDVIDGALALHAQQLAALQRLRMDELDLTGQKARIVGRIVDLIDPTKTPAASVSCAVRVPATDRTALIADAIGPTMLLGLQDAELFDEPGRERIRDWIKWISETVAALPADRTAVLQEAADAIDRETQALKDDGVLEPDKFRPCRDASAQLRRLAGGSAGRVADDTQPETRPAVHEWFVETRMLDGRWSKYGASRDTAEDGRELFEQDISGARGVHAFRLVHATTTFATEAEHEPAAPAVGGAQQPQEGRP